MESGNIGEAYGAGAATGTFSISAYFKKPQVICRCIGVLFSIVVFGCISSQGWWNGRCQYNNDPNACGFGVTIGVISFLGLLCLLLADGLFDNISSIQTRKYVVLADIAFSALWTFMWFVCFCYLTDAWRKAVKPIDDYGKSGVQAAIVFSFFSIIVYAMITSLAIMRYKAGVSETFMARSEFDADYVSPNSRTPASSSSGYAGIGGSNVEAGPFGAPRPSTATYK